MKKSIQEINELRHALNQVINELAMVDKSLIDTTQIKRYLSTPKRLSSNEILDLETEHSVSFPNSFEEFISQIGFGGAYRRI